MQVLVLSQSAKLEVVLDILGLASEMLAQCINGFILTWSLATGFLSHTLILPGQRGVVIILQDDQVRGGFTSVALGLQLVRPVGEGFVIQWISGRMFFPDLFPVF